MKKIVFIFALCFCSVFLNAQQQNSLKIDTAITLSGVEVSATRADLKTPVSQKNISRNDISKAHFGQDVPYFLNSTPSVSMYSDGGNQIGYMYMRLRGIDQTRINFTLNGVPLSEPEDQGCYFSNYTDFMANVGSVQIQRGVGTSTNGTASFAGSVNFESPNLYDTAYSGLSTGYGSYNSNRMSAVFNSGILKNGTAVYGRYSSNYSDGYRHHSGTDASTFFISGGHYGKKDIIKFTAFSGKSKNQMAYLATSEADIKNDPRTNYLSPDEKDLFRQDFAQLQHTHIFGSNSFVTSSLYYTGLSGNYDVYFSPDMLNFSLFSDLYGVTSAYSYIKGRTKIVAGINASSYYRNHSMSISPMFSQKIYSNRGTKEDASAFTKISYDLKKLTLFADVQGRISQFSYVADKNYGISVEPVTWKFLNPKVGTTYSFNNKINVYASVGKMHREPTRNDMLAGFDDIDTSNVSVIGDLKKVKPEDVTDYEVGTNIKFRNATVQANVYRMDFKNEIAAIGQLSYIGLPLRKNVESSYRQGVELDYSLALNKWLSVSGNVSYMDAKIKTYTTDYDSITYKNVSPLLTPKIILNQSVDFTSKSFTASVFVRHSGKSYLDNTMNDTLMMPSTTLFGASASVKFSKNCSVSVVANNLFDTLTYGGGYSMGGQRYYYVMAGRNLFATLNVKF